MTQEILRRDLLKEPGKYREIRTGIRERKFKMLPRGAPRPIFKRIVLLDHAPGRRYLVASPGCDQGLVPVRDDVDIIHINKRSISCRSKHRLFLNISSHDILQKNDYNTRIIFIYRVMSRKIVTSPEKGLRKA